MDFDIMTTEELTELRQSWTRDVEETRANLRLLVKELGRRAVIEEAERKVAMMSEPQKEAMRKVVQVAGIDATDSVGEVVPKKRWWERILG